MINRKPTIKEVIVSLVGDKAGFYFEEGVITEWFSETLTQPSQSAIDAEMARLQAEYDAQAYTRDRQYPSIGDQLDMIFHAGLGGDVFQAAIQAVKDANPKV
jgi:hypothetical protein